MEVHSGLWCHSVLSPAAIYITNCHLKPALRFIPYVFLCGGVCFHLICHNSGCPAGLCTTVALHRPPLVTSLSTGRFSLLYKDAWVCSAVACNKIFLRFGLSHTSVLSRAHLRLFARANKSNYAHFKMAPSVSLLCPMCMSHKEQR